MRTFLTLWLGQMVSQVGSMLTSFALAVWVYRQTGSVTEYSLIILYASLPGLLFAPFAGVLIDRWGRRRAMIIGDSVAALATLSLAAGFWAGVPHLLHLRLAVAMTSLGETLRAPAYAATVPLLVPQRHLTRAAGMAQLGVAAADLIAPSLAAFLLVRIGYSGVLLIDLSTFFFALAVLALARIPAVAMQGETAARLSPLDEILEGWHYVRARRGLVSLMAFFAVVNLLIAAGFLLQVPLVLSAGSAADLGLVLSVGGAGMLAGGLLISAWGGPQDRMRGVLGFSPLLGLSLLATGLAPSRPLLLAGVFGTAFSVPLINASNQAIWQSKVSPEVQGRVFALSRMVAQSTAPVSYLLAGSLADRVFTPLLLPGGRLAEGLIGRIFGSGPGRGTGLLMALAGLLLLAASAAAGLSRALRRLDLDLPDVHRKTVPAETAPESGGSLDLC